MLAQGVDEHTATTERSTLFAPMVSEPQFTISPTCNWDTEEYRFDGQNGECVHVRGGDGEKPLWYTLEEGTCDVVSGNATHVHFNIRAESGIAFTASPHKFVLDPHEQKALSNVTHFQDQQVSLLVRQPGDREDTLYLGTLHVTSDSLGMLVGERLHGADHDVAGEFSCVLGSVQQENAYSAVGVGTCTSDGGGGVKMDIEFARAFKASGAKPRLPLSFFDGVNAAIFSPTGGYQVLTIDHINNDNQLSGQAYFSTHMGTWETPLGPGTKSTGACFIFVDDKVGKTTSQVKAAVNEYCQRNNECSYFWEGDDCLREGCACYTWSGGNCGDGLKCEPLGMGSAPLNTVGNAMTAAGPAGLVLKPFEGIIQGFAAWVTDGIRVCQPYTTADRVANVIAGIADVAVVAVLIGAAAGYIGLAAGSAAGEAGVIAGAENAISGAELFQWSADGEAEGEFLVQFFSDNVLSGAFAF